MKLSNRILALLLAVLLLTAAAPAALAAGSQKTGYAGDSVVLTFSYSDIYGVDGSFSLDDPNGIVESWSASGYSGNFSGDASGQSCFLYGTSAGNATVKVTVKLKGSAQVGQSASVYFSYSLVTDDMGNVTDYKTDTAKVTVVERVAVVEPTPTPPTPVTPTDYSELERQIALANGLNEADYTAETWAALLDALTAANEALQVKEQAVVDTAAADLKAAIEAMVKMDYSALEEALKKAQAFVGTQEMGGDWLSLGQAVGKGQELLTSGDQAAVDAVTAQILDALTKLEAYVPKEVEPEIVYKDKIVEVPPTTDFCNISSHRIWPILFFVSLGLNVLLGGAVILVISVRKKKHDDTPLVDYNIDDDMI